jgi:putative transposase
MDVNVGRLCTTNCGKRSISWLRATVPVRILCDVLGVSPASHYYALRSRPESRRSAIVDDIKRVHRKDRGRYGSSRVYEELKTRGRRASRGRIEKIDAPSRHSSQQASMAGPSPTDMRPDFPIAPEPSQSELRHCCAKSDLARRHQLSRDRRWLLLASVMGFYTRGIVGWAMEDHLRTELPLAELKMAIAALAPA